jgi:hypothetical protein
VTDPSVLVDGVRYVPETASTPKVGVGITTHNRYETFSDTYRRIVELSPGLKVVVVDDASTEAVPEATFRFDTQAGIARSKNKCLELLEECEHIFLFDDDCYPLVEDWWRPYVESPEPHLMRIFEDLATKTKLRDMEVVYRDSRHVAYTGPRGPMLYVDRRVLDVVGGMDLGFGLWGWEHGDWSNRIHAAGLTSWRYADVAGSDQFVYCLDEHEAVTRSVPKKTRDAQTPANFERCQAQKDEPVYCEWREQRDLVLTCLFTGVPDPQRGKPMAADAGQLQPLLKSLRGHNVAVLHDGLKVADATDVECLEVDAPLNPYFQRWFSYWQYLRDHPEIRFVWCVDGTDVEMLNDPFPTMEPGRLYVGDEQATVANDWLASNHKAGVVQEFIGDNPGVQLVNAGLVGGDRTTVMAFLHDLIRAYGDNGIARHLKTERHDLGSTDMGAFNQVARTRWADKLVHGPQVNTVFKANDRNSWSWWKHK